MTFVYPFELFFYKKTTSMKKNYLLLLFICVLFIIPNNTQAQVVDTTQVYKRKKNAHEMEAFFKKLEEYRKEREKKEKEDTTKIPMIVPFRASPEQLRKLEIDSNLILKRFMTSPDEKGLRLPPDKLKQLQEYNAQQDSLQKIKEEIQQEAKEQKVSSSEQQDTTKNPMIERITATTPEQLRKLGVPPDIIKELQEYNAAIKDSLQQAKERIQKEAEKKGKKEEEKKSDSPD